MYWIPAKQHWNLDRMLTDSCRNFFGFIITLTILLNACIYLDIQFYPRSCDDEQFQCWFEKKQELNKNIARVCRKYGESIKIPYLQIDKEKQKQEFLHYDKMVYCTIPKVLIIKHLLNATWYIFSYYLKKKWFFPRKAKFLSKSVENIKI